MNAEQANNIKDKVRKLQVKLYLSAKESSSRRYHALYDKLYRMDILKRAWQNVKLPKLQSLLKQPKPKKQKNLSQNELIRIAKSKGLKVPNGR